MSVQWRIANGEWRIGRHVERNNQFVSGSTSVAGFYGADGGVLSADAWVSEGRDLRIDIADQALRRLGSGEYRRGAWTREYKKLHSISSDRSRLSEGAGDASFNCGEDRHSCQSGCQSSDAEMRRSWKNAPCSHPIVTKQKHRVNCEFPVNFIAVRTANFYSLFAIRYSRLAGCSPLARTS